MYIYIDGEREREFGSRREGVMRIMIVLMLVSLTAH